MRRDVVLSVLCSTLSGCLLAAAPVASALYTVLGLCFLLGGLCTLQYCVAYRLIMLLEQNLSCNGWLEVGLSFGFQSSVFVVLAAKRIVGFEVWNGLPAYFVLCASVNLLSIIAAIRLLRAGSKGDDVADDTREHELVPLTVEDMAKQRSQSEGQQQKESSLRRRSADFEPSAKVSLRPSSSREDRLERRILNTDTYLCIGAFLQV